MAAPRFSTAAKIRLEMETQMEAPKHHETDGKFEVTEYIELYKFHEQGLALQTRNQNHAQLALSD